MKPAMTILILMLGWAGATGSFSFPNLLLGAALGLVTLLLLRDHLAAPLRLRRLGRIARLAGLFLREVTVSTLQVARLVLSRRLETRLRPALIAFPLKVTSDAQITLLANLITLTPGTLSVDVSEDRRTLLIHALSAPDRQAVIASIAGGFETGIIEVFA